MKQLFQVNPAAMVNEENIPEQEASTRERLLNAGMSLFAKKGFEKATVREICKHADANLNAIKHHFGDKWELYLAVLQHCRDAGGSAVELDVQRDSSAEEQLHAFIHSVVKTMFKRRESTVARFGFQLMMRELQNPTGALKVGMKFFIVPYWNRLNAILDELLPDDVDQVSRNLMAFSVMGQISSYRFNEPMMKFVVSKSEFDRISAKKVADHITRVTLAAAQSYYPETDHD
ncbi:MAG: CerR family C-terminal domain-containing protein [Planctomycetota bacterium]